MNRSAAQMHHPSPVVKPARAQPPEVRGLPCVALVHSSKRERWLKARHSGLGASAASTIMGLNPYESEFTLYQKLVGAIGASEPDNDFMEWGRRLERVVVEAFADKTGRKVYGGGWLVRSGEHPHLLATPDSFQRLGRERGLLEIKTGGSSQAEDWQDGAPPQHQCQLQQQMLVTGLKHGSVAALIGGNAFFSYDYLAHERFQRALIKKTLDFWRRVQLRAAPEPDDSPSTSRTLSKMIEDGRAITLPDVVLEWHMAAVKASDDEKAAKERKDEYRRKIIASIGTAACGLLPRDLGVYRLATEKRKSYRVKASSSRVLRFNKKFKG